MAITVPTTSGDISTVAVNAGTNIVFPKAANVVANDLLVAGIHARLNTAAFTTIPSNWFELPPSGADVSGSGIMRYYWHVATSSEPSTYTWSGGISGRNVGVMFRVLGVDPASVVDAAGAEATAIAVSGSTLTLPTVSPSFANGLLLALSVCGQQTGDARGPYSTPTGMTRIGTVGTTTGGSESDIAVDYQVLTASGATGTRAGNRAATAGFGLGYLVTLRATAANLPPTVSAPANQNLTAAALATVNFPESDDVGVVSRTTAFDIPTSGGPTITNPGSQSSTFTTGAAGNLYVVRRRVTDAGGLFAEATTEVRVPLASSGVEVLPLALAPSGAWVATGGTTAAVLADSSDSTYYESPVLSSTETAIRARYQPSASRTDGTITVRLAKTDVGSATVSVRLFQNNTQVGAWAVTVSTTPTDYVHALTSGELSAISDWGALYVEVGATT